MSENTKLISAGCRTIQESGDSIVIALPKRDLRNNLDVDPEEIVGETVTYGLDESGRFEADMSRLAD